MPITTNKPVNFILFSIVLLVIMGLCICIAPDTAYAAYERPANTYIAPIPVNIPCPPESEFQGWVAVSDGTNVRVFLTSYVPGSVVIDGGFHTTLDDIDTVNYEIELAMFGPSNPAITVVRWDSDASTYRVAYHNDNAVSSWAYTFDTWVKPSYVAYGGCVSFIDDSTSIASFVPVWSDSSRDYDHSDYVEDNLDSIYERISDVYYSSLEAVDLIDEISLALWAEEGIYVGVSEISDKLSLIHASLQNVYHSVNESYNQLTVLPGMSEDLASIDARLYNTYHWVYQSYEELVQVNTQLLSTVDALTVLPGMSEDLSSIDDRLYNTYHWVRQSYDQLVEVNTQLSSIAVSLSSLDGLSDSVDLLNQSIVDLDSSFSQISSDLQELTAAIEAETEIWENSKMEYMYDSVDDHSVSAFGNLWDWLINPFMSLFVSSAPNGEIGYAEESLEPGSVVTRQLSVGQYFQDVFFNSTSFLPSYSNLSDIDIGGLP